MAVMRPPACRRTQAVPTISIHKNINKNKHLDIGYLSSILRRSSAAAAHPH
jgi:hypothetical protein